MSSFGLEVHCWDMENYDPKIAKMRSSISWLLSLSSSLSDSTKSQTLTPSSHFENDGSFTAETERLLTGGMPYRNILSYIFADQLHCETFADMLKVLNHQRMYFMTEEQTLTSQQLVTVPVHLDAHLQLIDIMMRAISSKVWASIHNVVDSLRRFPNFLASKELPCDYKNAVVMWLTKISTTASRSFPMLIRHLDDLCDSCVLLCTLQYYCPHVVSLNDIILKKTTSIADALHNLTVSLNFCYTELFPSRQEHPTSFLSPHDFIHCNETLQENFFAFFSFLFYCVEINPDPRLVRPRGSKDHKSKLHYPAEQPGSRISSCLATSEPTSTLSDVKSLISEVTKRSFNPDASPFSSTSSFQTAPFSDCGDVSSKSTFSVIPHVPLLPRRYPEELSRLQDVEGNNHCLPSGLSTEVRLGTINGTGDGTQTKWTTEVQPFQLPPHPDVNESIDSSISVTPREKHHLYHPVPSSLLSKVDVDDDIADLLSERTYDVEVPGLSSDFAWEGFEPGRFHRSNYSSLSKSYEDMKLETVRTVENNSQPLIDIPKGQQHFQALPFLNNQHPMTSSSSDLTVITTDLARSENSSSSPQSLTVDAVEPTALSHINENSPLKSNIHSNHNKIGSHQPLQASYTVADPTVFNVTSAKAAGYPIIDNSVDSRGFVQKPSSAQFNGLNAVDTTTKPPLSCVDDYGLTQPMASQSKVNRWANYRWNPREVQPEIKDDLLNCDQTKLLDRLEIIANKRREFRNEEKFEDERKKQEALRVRSIQCIHQIERWRLNSERSCYEKDKSNNAICTPEASCAAHLFVPSVQESTSSSYNDSSTLKNATPGHVTSAPGATAVPEVVHHEATVDSSAPEETKALSCRKLFTSKALTNHQGGLPEVHEMTESYDSFLHQVKPPSCHSTPSKVSSAMSPEHAKDKDGASKKVLGFTILDERSPASELAKKKEQFLLGRVRKEEELRQKQMEREAEVERKKTEAREQQEKIMLKKQEEKKKREKIFKEYQKRKQNEEATKQQAGVIGENMNGSHKQHHRSRTNSRHNDNLDTLRQFDTSPTPLGLTVPISSNLSSSSGKTALHYHLSKDNDSDSAESGSSSGAGSEYTGPKLYKQLSAKSNRILISNALNHCCLSGRVNDEKRSKASQALDGSEDHHFMVLFRDQQCQFRGLYSYHVREEKLHKIYGSGPSIVKPWMIESLFKYNSGRRAFSRVASKTLAVSIDAITIKNSLWNHSSAKK